MRVTVVGTGYVGLVTGACLADFGNTVCCLDSDDRKVEALKAGQIPIYEPGLEELVTRHVAAKRLTFTSSYAEAVSEFEPTVVFLAVGTPYAADGAADLRHVRAAAGEVGHALRAVQTVVVNKSTVPVGTADLVEGILRETVRPGCSFSVVSNPEFLKEGTAVADFMRPDRVVVGLVEDAARRVMTELYKPVVRDLSRLYFTSRRSAELSKYACNAMLATRISFMNELACLAEKVGADIEDVRQVMSTDPRIGAKFLYAGCGWGGSCFGKDLYALCATGAKHAVPLRLAKAALDVNIGQQYVLSTKINDHFGDKRGTVAVWGLAFKPETDDARDAPALSLIEDLCRNGWQVRAFDPRAAQHFADLLLQRGAANIQNFEVADSAYNALVDADALVLVTEWHEFRRPDWSYVKKLLRRPVLFDGRNVWDREEVKRLGFTCYGIGR